MFCFCWDGGDIQVHNVSRTDKSNAGGDWNKCFYHERLHVFIMFIIETDSIFVNMGVHINVESGSQVFYFVLIWTLSIYTAFL